MALDPTLLVGLRVLRPYLDDIVIAGGWVPYLYAAHLPPADEAVALKTRDLARGDNSGVRTVQNGLTAQELHYVDLLLEHTWTLPLDALSAGELEGNVRVPTPAAFILQKALSHKSRTDPLKREKDLYYIFYVVDGFRGWHPWIREELKKLAATRRSWSSRAQKVLEAAFETPRSSGVDALLNQRPGTAYSGLDNDQFRQYAWSVMQMLLEMMREGQSADGM